MNIDELVKQLRYYRKCYYDGNPVISDDIFDQMEKELERIDPSNKYFDEVGFKTDEVIELKKIKHIIPMKSMAKVKSPDEALKWYNNILVFVDPENRSENLYFEAKIDGNAGSLTYNEKGNLRFVLSRGDGLEGIEIPLGFKFKNIPQKFIPNGEIRGEFYISKKDRDKFSGPLRNACSGVLKRKEESPEMDYIQFVMYDWYDHKNGVKFDNRKDKIDKLKELLPPGSNIIDIMSSNNIRLMYDKYINKLREQWDYETDGIILTVEGGQDVYDSVNRNYNVTSHNKYNLALKPPAEEGYSKIVDIRINVSKHGRIVPVAIIEPVQVGGIMISAVTMDNIEFINKNKVGIGSYVTVSRANDVIPTITSVKPDVNVTQFKLDKCPSCGSVLVRKGNVDAYCENNFGCKNRYVNRILYLFRVFGIKNVGEKYVKSIVEWLFSNRKTVYLWTFLEFFLDKSGELDMVLEELFGCSTRKNNIYTAIMKIFDNVTELNILDCVSIPNIGRKTLESLGITDKEKLKTFVELKEKNNEISITDGVIISWYKSKFKDEYDKVYEILKKFIKKEEVFGDKGEVCLSGSFDQTKSELYKLLSSKGFKPVENVNKNTNYLISNIGGTLKSLKASKLGIPIFTWEEFEKLHLS